MDAQWSPVDLGTVTYPALSPWFGQAGKASYFGAGDCALWTAMTSDPEVAVRYNWECWSKLSSGAWKHSGNDAATEAEIRGGIDDDFQGYEINPYSTADPDGFSMPAGVKKRTDPYWSPMARIPEAATPARNADAYMAVLQPNGWVLETMATIRLSDGTIVCGFAGYTDPLSPGDGAAGGRRASLAPNYAGLLRQGELSAGVIDHALALALTPDALARTAIYPARAIDRNPFDYSGSLPMGTLLALPADIDIAQLTWASNLGPVIARAFQRYGGYVVDRGGPGILVICSQTGASDVPPWSWSLAQDLDRIVRLLQRVSLSQPRYPGVRERPS